MEKFVEEFKVRRDERDGMGKKKRKESKWTRKKI